jgi:hypothetical protein
MNDLNLDMTMTLGIDSSGSLVPSVKNIDLTLGDTNVDITGAIL